ncbi:MAG: mechanosensitive ion channel family protein [Gemmatimonadales bacterium]|jgi:small-conductance mechanosensitive channel
MDLTWSEIRAVVIPAAIALLGLVVGLIVRRTVVARLGKVAEGTRSVTDDIVLSAVRGPVVLWFLIGGLYAAIQITTLPQRVAVLIQQLLLILVIFSITWAIARVVAALVENGARRAPETLPGATLVTNLARVTVLAIGILVILQTLGISIAPIITALGIGGLAVALALQDTLANLFAGVHILASRQLRPGDYVKLDSGEEGYVVDVTWRQTTIRQLPNNIIIVPNKQIASSITTNYHLPDQQLSFLVPVGVHYGSDLGHVERVTIEVARETLQTVEGGVPDWEPFIRYSAFGDSSINFNVILRGQEYVCQYLLRHEFIKRLHRRFDQEGIVIPFPIRTVVLEGQQEVA